MGDEVDGSKSGAPASGPVPAPGPPAPLVVELPLGLGFTLLPPPPGYDRDPRTGALLSDEEILLTTSLRNGEARRLRRSPRVLRDRRAARLEGMYAALSRDPDRLGLVYQVVGRALLANRVPGTTQGGHAARITRHALAARVLVTLGFLVVGLLLFAPRPHLDDGLYFTAPLNALSSGVVFFALFPLVSAGASLRDARALLRQRAEGRALLRRGRALTVLRVEDDPTVVPQVAAAWADPAEGDQVVSTLAVLAARAASWRR